MAICKEEMRTVQERKSSIEKEVDLAKVGQLGEIKKGFTGKGLRLRSTEWINRTD